MVKNNKALGKGGVKKAWQTKRKAVVKAPHQAKTRAVKGATKSALRVTDKSTIGKKPVSAAAAVRRAPARFEKNAVAPAKMSVSKMSVSKMSVSKPSVAAKASAPAPEAVEPMMTNSKAALAGIRAARSGGTSATRVMPAAVTKSAGQKITAPATPRDIAAKAQQKIGSANKKPVNQRHGFKTNEWIVYPSHGVGRIVGIEEQEIAGISLELFVITFEKDKMTLRVPTGKSQSVGMRKLSDENVVKRAMDTLKGKARIRRTMWSRRAQEYEAKINSGDLVSIAEVVRDLFRSESQPEQSYSERQLFEAALDRMAREIAAVEKLDERGAVQRITEVLTKSAKGRRMGLETAEAINAA
jgi:CarD family transcriptional regulator